MGAAGVQAAAAVSVVAGHHRLPSGTLCPVALLSLPHHRGVAVAAAGAAIVAVAGQAEVVGEGTPPWRLPAPLRPRYAATAESGERSRPPLAPRLGPMEAAAERLHS